MRFKWIAWNRGHIARHAVSEREAEEVLAASTSVHRVRHDGSIVTSGNTLAGRRLYVVWREDESVDVLTDIDPLIFVITAYEV